MRIFLYSFCLSLLLSNCAMNSIHNKKNTGIVRVKQFTDKKSTFMWAHHDATQRQTLMYVDELGNIKIIAEQAPDAGLSKVLDISGNGKITDELDVGAFLNSKAQLEKLTNRTTSLMITRENLYAIRELHFNNAIDNAQVIGMYDKFLDKLADIMKQDVLLEEARAKSMQADADISKVELEKMKLEKEVKENSDKGNTTSDGDDKMNADKTPKTE